MPVLGVVASSCRAVTFKQVLVVGLQSSPGEATWSWDAGFGTKYAAPSNGVNTDTPFFNTVNFNFSRAGNAAFMGSATQTYPWDSNGYGTAYSAPTPAPTVGSSADWGPSDAFIVVRGDPARDQYTPIAYQWSSSGYGTAYSSAPTRPDTYIINGLNELAVSPNGNYVALATSAQGSPNPRLRALRFNVSSGWGTYLVQPSLAWGSSNSNVANSVDFTPSQDAIAISYSASPYVYAWPFSDGFGTRYSNPITLPTGTGYKVRFSPSESTIALSHATSPFVSVYPWSSGFGSKYADPATLPTAQANGLSFSATGDAIAVSQSGVTPAVSVYAWSSGFGTKYADAAESTTGGNKAVFSRFQSPI